MGLATHKSGVRVLPRQHCAVALGKLLTPVRLCHQAVYLGTGQKAVTPWGWEGDRRSGDARVTDFVVYPPTGSRPT